MSSGCAQFDLGGVIPRVPLPSRTAGLNGHGLDGGVELPHGPHEAVDVDLELARQLLDGAGLGLRDLADPVLLAEERHHLLVEELEGGSLGLPEDLPPVLGVGVVAEVGALVDEALARGH